jgi:hypothetical protein
MEPRKPFLQLAVFALIAGLLWPSPSHAYRMMYKTASNKASSVPCNNQNGFEHWPSSQGTIYWYYNPAGQGAGKESEIRAALKTWTDATESDHVLQLAGTMNDPFSINDNKNTISWGDTSSSSLCNTTPCHAITVVRLSSQHVLSDVDIVLNQLLDWRTDGQSDACANTGAGTKVDTQGIITHELGHSLGLGHPAPNETSYPYATMGLPSCSKEARDLHSDDRAGLQCSTRRYPFNPSYEGSFDGYAGFSCTQISGWAWNANKSNDPVYVNILDGSTVHAVVLADQYRADLVTAGKGNGRHGFVAPLPDWFKDGTWHTLRTQFSGTGGELTGSPKQIICGVNLFPTSMDPDDPALSTGGVPYEVGTQFESSVAGYITHIGYYFQGGEGAAGAHTVRLWSDTGAPLASASIDPPAIFGQIGWSYALLPNKVPIQSGVRYRASVNTIAYQSKSSCGTPTSLQNPYVSEPLKAWRGFWRQGSGVFPNTSSCSNFFVSVKFEM